jgi:hypothetical protein
MNRFNHHGDLAAALHALADDVAALPPFDLLPDLSVRIDIEATAEGGTPAARMAAVDALMFALFGLDGSTSRTGRAWRYGSPPQGSDPGTGLQVSVSTAVPAPLSAVA